MDKRGIRRAPLSARVGLPRERLRVGRARFAVAARDLTILPDDAAPPYPTIAAMHGMGMRAEIFARWLRRLTDEPWAWLFPDGPFPLERKTGHLRMIGHAWYLFDGNTPSFRNSLRRSERRLLKILDARAERHGLDRAKLILLGFSQGGYFAGSVGLRHAERFCGIAVAGGRIRPEYACRSLETAPRIPILFLHGKYDPVVPIAAAAESAERMRSLGFPVTWIEVDGEHTWNEAMTEAFRGWARGVFAAGRPAPHHGA